MSILTNFVENELMEHADLVSKKLMTSTEASNIVLSHWGPEDDEDDEDFDDDDIDWDEDI